MLARCDDCDGKCVTICVRQRDAVALHRKRAAQRRAGRPRIGEEGKTLEATKPWVKLKMSRRTWFRRQKEKREASQ